MNGRKTGTRQAPSALTCSLFGSLGTFLNAFASGHFSNIRTRSATEPRVKNGRTAGTTVAWRAFVMPFVFAEFVCTSGCGTAASFLCRGFVTNFTWPPSTPSLILLLLFGKLLVFVGIVLISPLLLLMADGFTSASSRSVDHGTDTAPVGVNVCDVITSGSTLSLALPPPILLSTVPVLRALISRSSSISTSSNKFVDLVLLSIFFTVFLMLSWPTLALMLFVWLLMWLPLLLLRFAPFELLLVMLVFGVFALTQDDLTLPFSTTVRSMRFFNGHAGWWLSRLAGLAGVSGFTRTGAGLASATFEAAFNFTSRSIVLISTSGTFLFNWLP